MCKIYYDAICENKSDAIAVILTCFSSLLLCSGYKPYVLLYIVMLVGTTFFIFGKRVFEAGAGTKASIIATIQLTIISLVASVFFFLRSITPEIFGLKLGPTDQAYFVITISGIVFLYFGILRDSPILRGPLRSFHIASYTVMFAFIPCIYFILLCLKYIKS